MALGRRVVYESDELRTCDTCATLYLAVGGACPLCETNPMLPSNVWVRALVEGFDREWDRLFAGLPGFVGWSGALAGAKLLAQKQRIEVLEVTQNKGQA